ncbi:MAG TPA: translocation/assembly module TamB domain-containing protein, partial [Pseudomonadota bacterium]|nr:translocation/assembly module TamB domain-containing protein [Pseudomonadota bacterium]
LAAGQLEIERLDVQAGHNTLSLNGKLAAPATPAVWVDPLAATAQLSLKIAAPRLDELHATHALLPALAGALAGQVGLELSDRALRVTTQLDGKELAGFGAQLAGLHIDVDSPDLLGLRGRVLASLSGARYGAEQLHQAELKIDGSSRDLTLAAELKALIAGQSLASRVALRAQPSYGDGLRPQAMTAQLSELWLQRDRDRIELLAPATIALRALDTAPVIEILDTPLSAQKRQALATDSATGKPRTRIGLGLHYADLRLFLSGRYETATGRVQGQLDLENVDAQGLAFAAAGRTDVPRSHLNAELRMAGTLSQPSGSARLSGTVDPLPGVVPWTTPLTLQAELAGTRQNPRGSVSLSMADWTFDRLAGDSAKLRLSYADAALTAQLSVPRVTTEQAPIGKVVVGGDIDVDWRGEALKVVAALNWDGAPWLRAQAGIQLALASAIAEGAGLAARLPQLPLTARLEMPAFRLPAGLPVAAELDLQAELQGSLSKPTATARLRAKDVQAGTWPVGNVALFAALENAGRVRAQALIDPGAAAPPLPIQPSPTASTVQPGALVLLADVPLPLSLTRPGLRVQLFAKGYRLDYEPKPAGTGSLRTARGVLDADLQVESATPQPVFQGSLRLSQGEIAATTLPQLLREITLAVELSRQGRITLRELFARAGRGTLKADGEILLADGQLRTLSLKSQAQNFPVAAGAYSVWLTTQVNMTGENDGQTLRTRIDIPRGLIDVPKLSTSNDVQALGPLSDVEFVDAAGRKAQAALLAAEAKEREETGQHKAVPFLPADTLVDVNMPGPFVINGPEVKTDLQGHVRAELRSSGGTRGDPIIQGDLHAMNGWLEILGRRYQIDRAQVSMSGEVPPNPLLDISISRKVEDATIYILVTGSAKKPVISFRSDPATYDQGQIIAMVLSGSSRGGGSIQQQALGALSSLVVGKLKDQLGAAVPVDVIKFDVGGNDAMGANQSSLEIGKYLRDNLYLSYTHRFGNPSTILRRMNNDQVALEWWFLRNYQIHLMGGDQGVGSLNLYWNKRF